MKRLLLICSIILLCGQSFAQLPAYLPTSGLRAWYPFTGNLNDSSGYARHGALYGSGGVLTTDRFGNANSCYRSTGSSFVNIPSHVFPLGDTARSVSVHFKIDSFFSNNIRELMGWGNGGFGGKFSLVVYDSILGIEYVNGGVTVGYTRDTSWHNLTVTYPATGGGSDAVKIYYDGFLVTGTTVHNATSLFFTDTGRFHSIGGTNDFSYSDSWKGKLDDVGVWSRELTACEVWQVAHASLTVPVAPITGPTSFCTGDTVLLASTTTGGVWTMLHGHASISTTGEVIGLTAGADTAVYTISTVCGPFSQTYPLTIQTEPTAGTISATSWGVCIGDTLYLYTTSSGGTWRHTNATAANLWATGMVTSLSAGVDTVLYTISNMCGADTARFVYYVLSDSACATGIGAGKSNMQLGVYPNPSSGTFNIVFAAAGGADALATITDAVGVRKHQQTVHSNKENTVSVDLAPGIYYLTVTTATTTVTRKLVINR